MNLSERHERSPSCWVQICLSELRLAANNSSVLSGPKVAGIQFVSSTSPCLRHGKRSLSAFLGTSLVLRPVAVLLISSNPSRSIDKILRPSVMRSIRILVGQGIDRCRAQPLQLSQDRAPGYADAAWRQPIVVQPTDMLAADLATKHMQSWVSRSAPACITNPDFLMMAHTLL